MKTYEGSCHCGKVTFSVETDLAMTATCNCSYCGRGGFIWAFVPGVQFTLKSGEGEQTTYHFNKKVIDHRFCKTCGVQCYGEGKDEKGEKTVAVNVRCIPELDISTLKPIAYNGKDL